MKEILRETGEATPRIKYNVNLFTHIKTHYEDEAEKAKDVENIKDLARFIKENAIPEMVSALQNEERSIYDSDSLSELMHSFGVNVRYLGDVIRYVNEHNKTRYVRALCERSIYSRSVKHVVNKYIREVPKEHLAAVVTHFLNLAVPSQVRTRADVALSSA